MNSIYHGIGAFRALLAELAAVALIPLSGCNSKETKASDESPSATIAGAAHSDEPEHEKLPKRIHLTPSVIEAAKIQTARATREKLPSTLELSGQIAGNPDRMARVTVPAPGRVEAIHFREGNMVRKGDLLGTVSIVDLPERKGNLLRLTAKAEAARANADRLHALGLEGLASTQEITSAKAEALALEAESKAHSESLRALGARPGSRLAATTLEVRAPIAGTIVERSMILGQPAAPEHPLATIVDLSEVWFLARVFEQDLARVKPQSPAEIELNAYPKERFIGVVEYVSRQVDETARTVVARIKLDGNKDAFRLGLFGTARIATDEEPSSPTRLVVPRSAITDLGGKPVTFVAHPGGDFEVHEVVLGLSALGKVEVLSGLSDGETVVTEGAFSIKSVILKSTFGEEE